MKQKNHINVLKKLYQLFEENNVFWILTGSLSLAIQGVDVEPVDIDIFTDKENVWKIDKLLEKYRIQAPNHSSTNEYQSYFGIYIIDGIKVDTMADFQYRLKNGDWSKINQSYKIIHKQFDDMNLPLLTLEQELKEYEEMGREDKAEKIKKEL